MDDAQAIRREANSVLERELGVSPPASTLHLHGDESWERLKRERKHRPKEGRTTLGLYFRSEDAAHVWTGYADWTATLYHELHGHGLYYGCSRTAKAGATSRGAPREWGLQGDAWRNSEGFASWMEVFLAERTGRAALARRAVSRMPADYRAAYEAASDVARGVSPVGFLRQMGIPCVLDGPKTEGVLRAMGAGRRIELAAMVPTPPSGAPVRVLVVTDDRAPIASTLWLTARVIDGERFIKEVVDRDPVLVRELREGQLLLGDAHAWRQARERLSSS